MLENTYFVPAERVSEQQLFSQISTVSKNPVISGLLESVGGLLAILNDKRQTLAINDTFLNTIGINDPAESFGLRIGEILKCIHSSDKPAGCGTTKYCSTCGAAIAMMSSLESNIGVEKTCALTVMKDGETKDLALEVRSLPLEINDQTYLMLFLRDITLQQKRAALERTFFHDINNMLFGLVGASELLSRNDKNNDLVRIIRQSALRLYKTVDIQRNLTKNDSSTYSLILEDVTIGQIHDELHAFYLNHPVKKNKYLKITVSNMTFSFSTDISLLQRILTNMITNALEASAVDGLVSVEISHTLKQLLIKVHNDQVIKPDIARRIFQRNFSTKGEPGRGVGTYSMKLFGEEVLSGKVGFTSTSEAGTIFQFKLPL